MEIDEKTLGNIAANFWTYGYLQALNISPETYLEMSPMPKEIAAGRKAARAHIKKEMRKNESALA